MKKLTAVKATNQDNQIISAAVDAIRSVLERFHEANKSIGFAPRAMLQVSVIDSRFSLTLEGSARSPANGRTIDEAMETLCSNPDAAFLRQRAAMLTDKAEELHREADRLEGIPPEVAVPVAAQGTAETDLDSVLERAHAAAVCELLEPIFNVLRQPFYGTAMDIQSNMPQIKTSRIRISKAIERNMMFFQDMLGLETKPISGVTHYSTPGTKKDFQDAVALAMNQMSVRPVETAPATAAGTEGGAE